MSKLIIFYLHACDDYNNSNLVKTRYYLSEDTGIVDTLEGLKNTVDCIFETIKRCDLVVQKIIFKDPTPEKDLLKINLPAFPKSGFSRMRPLSPEEREDFCRILIEKMSEAPLTKSEERSGV